MMTPVKIKQEVQEYLDAIGAISLFSKREYTEEELIEYCCAVAEYLLQMQKDQLLSINKKN